MDFITKAITVNLNEHELNTISEMNILLADLIEKIKIHGLSSDDVEFTIPSNVAIARLIQNIEQLQDVAWVE